MKYPKQRFGNSGCFANGASDVQTHKTLNMKKNCFLKYIPAMLLGGVLITACEKEVEEPVVPARTAATVADDYYNTKRNQAVELKVLTNDPIGTSATVQYGQPVNGTIQNTNGAVFYVPGSNFSGLDSLSYTACLGNDCATAMVRIKVLPDSAGTCVTQAVDDVRNMFYGYADTISVLKNDQLCGIGPNSTQISITQSPLHGQASINFLKQVSYFPDPNYTGPDELTYSISNSNGRSSAKLRLNVNPAPCQIRANHDNAYLQRVLGTVDTISVNVLANDIICPNNGPITVQLVNTGQPQHGTFNMIGTGAKTRIIYTTSAGKGFTDQILYNISQNGLYHNAYLNIHVQ